MLLLGSLAPFAAGRARPIAVNGGVSAFTPAAKSAGLAAAAALGLAIIANYQSRPRLAALRLDDAVGVGRT
jgi:hypothetical protein